MKRRLFGEIATSYAGICSQSNLKELSAHGRSITPYLCHLAPMPTSAVPSIPQSPNSTCQPVNTPLAALPSPAHLKSELPPPKSPHSQHFTMATTTATPSFAPFFLRTQLLFSFLATLLLLLLTSPIPSCSFTLELKVSGISAAPAFLPVEPKYPSIPPALAPDMMPLFPSPGGNARGTPAGILPIIPSSPSPPNPDELQPNSAITPSGSAAGTPSAASPTSLGNLGGASMAFVCELVLMWWLELVDW